MGSGGTAAGLIIGNYLTGNQHNLHLLQVADTVDSLTNDIKSILVSFSLDKTPLDAEEVMKNVTMHEAVGEGYAIRQVVIQIVVFQEYFLVPTKSLSLSNELPSRLG